MEKKKKKKAPPETTVMMRVDNLQKTIPVVCSWCNSIYNLKCWEVPEGKQTAVSHGMCPDCEKKQQQELDRLDDMLK